LILSDASRIAPRNIRWHVVIDTRKQKITRLLSRESLTTRRQLLQGIMPMLLQLVPSGVQFANVRVVDAILRFFLLFGKELRKWS
jgi:hypothetical protein